MPTAILKDRPHRDAATAEYLLEAKGHHQALPRRGGAGRGQICGSGPAPCTR